MLGRDSSDDIWSRFVLDLVIWPEQVTLVSRTQPSGPLCLWQCFITKEDGSILLGLKSLVFESYALLMDAQFIYWKLEKMHLDLKYGFAYWKYFILNYGFVYWKCRLAKGLLARIPTGFTVTLLLQLWTLLRVLWILEIFGPIYYCPTPILLVLNLLSTNSMFTTLFPTLPITVTWLKRNSQYIQSKI